MFVVQTVCTGNVCRSPLVEHLLARSLDRRGMRRGDHFDVFSTGTSAFGGGAAMSNGSWRELKVRGVDPGRHASRQADVESLARSDLVLTMEAAHSRYLAALDADCTPRVFTLKEIVAILEAHDGAPWQQGVGAVPMLHAARPRIPPAERRYDVADPIGGTAKVYARCAQEIEDLVERMVTPLWGAPLRAASDTSNPGHQNEARQH
ncbi:MAG: hypothetical protein U0U69_06415 [Acidimicrobiia bacterium]